MARPRVILEIDLDRIAGNYRRIAEAVHPLKVMAVLKADAYGLGVRAIAERLCRCGVHAFGVAELREALAVHPLGRPVHILGGLIHEDIPVVVRKGIVAPITDLDIARRLSAEAVAANTTAHCHVLIDTGMGRLGVPLADAEQVVSQAVSLPGLGCEGIYSHFPYAYADIAFSNRQVEQFKALLERLALRNIAFRWVHMANSDGINNVPPAALEPFNLVRTGINLYGVYDIEGAQSYPLQPVLSLKARLVAARELPAGTSLGYGRTYFLRQKTRVGTVAIGYADGLPLAMSNRGDLIVRGRRCPILGRVSMDYTTISLDPVPEARVGDTVTCLGEDITVREWAQIKGTIPYEIICSFGQRVAREYHEN